MSLPGEERTYDPTPRRREEARRRGQVARNTDFVGAATVLVALCVLRSVAGPAWEKLKAGFWFLSGMGNSSQSLSIGDAVTLGERLGYLASFVLLPVALAVAATAIVASALSSGFLVRPGAVVPQLSRLSPTAGLARVVSARGAGRGVLALLKSFVLFGALAWGLSPLLKATGPLSPETLMMLPLPIALGRGLDHVLDVATYAILGLVTLGLLEWLLQRWFLERELRMTRREIEEERREVEESQETKNRRRALSRRLLGGLRERPGHGTQADGGAT